MKSFWHKWRFYFLFAFFFSLFINILQLTFPIYMLTIYDRVLASYSMPTLVAITVGAVFALLVMGLLDFTRSRLLVRAGVDVDQTLSGTVLDAQLKDAARVDKQGYSHGLKDVNTLRNFLGGNAIFFLFDAPWVPIYLLIIYLLHPVLGMVATAGAVLLACLAFLNEKLTRKPLDQANQVNSAAQRFIQACQRNGEAVRSMGMLPGVAQRHQALNDRVIKQQTLASRRAGALQSSSKTLRMMMQVTIYGVGAYLVLQGESTAGTMIAASIIMGRGLQPIEMGIGSWKQMVEAQGAYKRLDQLLRHNQPQDTMDLPQPEGRLQAEGVTLALGGRYVLRNVAFDLEPGESLALIGPSAAGKSTLCRLILGIWPATAGKVRLDGADIYAWEQEKLGPYIGYLPQDVELFNGTVSDNIARMGAVDSEKVVTAAQKAGVHDMILNLPNGYDTQIGEAGTVLSGGQRQRIGLARALYGDPCLLVLDEPNASLDDAGEKALLGVFKTLKDENVTLVVTSHKPSLLSGVDKVLMLKAGQVAMYGPRQEVFQRLSGNQRQQAAGSGPRPVE